MTIGPPTPFRTIVYDGFTQLLALGGDYWEQPLVTALLRGRAAKNRTEAQIDKNHGELFMAMPEGRRIKAELEREGIEVQRELRDQDGGLPRLFLHREFVGLMAMHIDLKFARYVLNRAYDADPDGVRRGALAVLGQPDTGPAPARERVTVESIRRNEDRERLEALRWTLHQGLADLTSRVTKISVDLPRMTHELGDVPALLRSTVTLLHEVVQGQVRIYDQFIRVQPWLIDGLSQNASKMAALILLQVAQGQPRAIQQTLDLG